MCCNFIFLSAPISSRSCRSCLIAFLNIPALCLSLQILYSFSGNLPENAGKVTGLGFIEVDRCSSNLHSSFSPPNPMPQYHPQFCTSCGFYCLFALTGIKQILLAYPAFCPPVDSFNPQHLTCPHAQISASNTKFYLGPPVATPERMQAFPGNRWPQYSPKNPEEQYAPNKDNTRER